MARRIRVEFPGAIYHVMNRGDRREEIFRDDHDRRRFLETLGETCAKTDWQVHAFCLMPNHFHLVVETPGANLVAGMRWFLGTYTGRFNRRHKLSGHLFSGRYKALLVGGDGGYLRTVCEYVHLNPVRAKLIRASQALRSFAWSSFGEYLKCASKRRGWLRVDRLLGEMGIPRDSQAGRRQFEDEMERRRNEDLEPKFHAIRRTWCYAAEQFRKELLEAMTKQVGKYHYGSEVHESATERADRIVAEELRRRRWKDSDLVGRAKGDAGKIVIAERLRRETTVTMEWIAQRLQMGTRTYLSHLLYWRKRKNSGVNKTID